MLEAETASYAAKRATPEDIEKISESYQHMIEYKDDVNLFVDYDAQFHMFISDRSEERRVGKECRL